MAHNISLLNGHSEMAYVGEKPWHDLGQELTPDAPLEVWAREAGMEWKVQKAFVRYNVDKDGADYRMWNDRLVLFRSDTKAPLGVVSDRYKIVQPIDVLKFFTDVAERNNLRLETAGTLGGGTKYWALARVEHADINLGGCDIIKPYIMLATSADGSMNTIAKPTTVRVVCQNTLGMALGAKGEAVKVRHSTTFKAEDVRIELGLLGGAIEEFEQQAASLASTPLTKSQAVHVLVSALGDLEQFTKDYQEKGATKAFEQQPNTRPMAAILELFNGGAFGGNLVTSNGTAWGLVNAATQYFDHTAGRSQDTRLTSSWFGQNADRKQAIVKEALTV